MPSLLAFTKRLTIAGPTTWMLVRPVTPHVKVDCQVTAQMARIVSLSLPAVTILKMLLSIQRFVEHHSKTLLAIVRSHADRLKIALPGRLAFPLHRATPSRPISPMNPFSAE